MQGAKKYSPPFILTNPPKADFTVVEPPYFTGQF